MAIDDNTLYGLTGAQVKEIVQRRGNTEISQESSTYGDEGDALSLDSNGTSGHLRVGVDIMNDGSEGFLYLNDSYPGIRFPSTDAMYEAITNGIPSDVSYFYNDANYQNASQVSSAIASAISGITSFSYEIVQTLPASGQAGTIYLIANTGTTPNIYDEYLWINGGWEKIGTTEADLSQYYTKTEVDTALGTKANSADVYTKTETNTALSAKADTTTVNTALATKANAADVYTKAQTDSAISTATSDVDKIEYIALTLTDIATMTFSVPKTSAEVAALMNAGKKVMYRMVIPSQVGGFAPGIYDFTAQYNFSDGSSTTVVATMQGIMGQTVIGTLGHAGSVAQARITYVQDHIDVNNKLAATLVDGLATVAISGAYSDLTGTPTIPTVNNATLTIQKNGSTVQTFTANASSNKTANIEVPVIIMTSTDPGEGGTLAANNFIAVYTA